MNPLPSEKKHIHPKASSDLLGRYIDPLKASVFFGGSDSHLVEQFLGPHSKPLYDLEGSEFPEALFLPDVMFLCFCLFSCLAVFFCAWLKYMFLVKDVSLISKLWILTLSSWSFWTTKDKLNLPEYDSPKNLSCKSENNDYKNSEEKIVWFSPKEAFERQKTSCSGQSSQVIFCWNVCID